MNFKILGREPTLWIAALAAVITLVATFNVPGLSAEQAALWIVVINAALGVINALLVRPVSPAAFTYLVSALAAVAVAYGLDVTEEQVGMVNTVVLTALALILRGQVSPQQTALTRR